MLVDRYAPEDVFARVPEVAAQTDPVLKALDRLLEDDEPYRQVRSDLGKRYRFTKVAWAPLHPGGSDLAYAHMRYSFYLRRTTIGTPPFGRKVSRGSGSIDLVPANSKTTCCASAAKIK